MTAQHDTAETSLPPDVASCHEMIKSQARTIEEQQTQIGQLETTIDTMIRERFGPKRERYVDPDQGLLFDLTGKAAEATTETAEPADTDGEPPAKKRRRGGTGRRLLDENRRREEHLHRLLDHQKQCPKCGAVLVITIVEGALQWSYRPAEIFGIQHLHEKGFCQCCHEHVVQAEKPPQMIPKGAADASLLAHLTTSNKGDHLPTYRLEEINLRAGWWIPRSTQVGWLSQTAVTGVLAYSWMASRILNGRLLATDATGVRVLEPGAGQAQQGTVWVYCGQSGVCPYLIYEYHRSGGGEVPRAFLAGYQGYLQADAASVFDQIYSQGPVYELACGAHMRRYFYKARETSPVEAHRALVYFRQLYLLERQLAGLSDEQRLKQRQAQALPLLNDFKSWLDTLAPRLIPKTPLAAAVTYAMNQWDAFVRYCDQGWLLIDNTRSERALRPIAIGRSNWLFFGSDAGGRTAAILYSLVASAKSNSVHPYFYLEDLYQQLPRIRESGELQPILREACSQVTLDDGSRPRLDRLENAMDYLRILKDHPRPLIELFRQDEHLPSTLIAALNALLPDRWLAEHPQAYLEINRSTRIVGEAA